MKPVHLKTKRLELEPMPNAEIEKRIEQSDEEMKKAYGEMLEGCQKDPANRIWYAPWKMSLKGDPNYIGDLCFKGPAKKNAVEIGYGIEPAYEGKGYTTEAVKAMIEWAFRQSGVYFVEAETEPDNKASQRILEKCGFVLDGTGKEGPRFVLESPVTNWATTYMCIGMSIGMGIGMTKNQMVLGMSIGMSLGVAAGLLMNQNEEKQRKKLRAERKTKDEQQG